MDFKDFDLTVHADRGAVLQVRHPVYPTQNLEGVTITLLGNDSSARKRRLAAIKQKAANDPKSATADVISEQFNESIIESVIAWTGIELDGVALECTKENVRKLLENPGYEWLKNQIDSFISDRRNFFLRSEKDSN